MSKHKDEDVEMLIDGIEELHPSLLPMKVTDALARLKPKSEKFYLIPEGVVKFLTGESALEDLWYGDEHPKHIGKLWWRKYLRELTAVDAPTAPVQEIDIQKQDPNEAIYKSIFNGTYKNLHISESMKKGYADWWHKNFRDKIMSMNEVK
jgi:hypothetical protein